MHVDTHVALPPAPDDEDDDDDTEDDDVVDVLPPVPVALDVLF